MRKTFTIVAAAIAVVLVAGYMANAGARHGRDAALIHVIEHATTDLVVDTGPTGDSSGDLLTFANDVYDETNVNKVGRDQGDCIRINTTEGSWECRWTTFLKGGAIMIEGPFYDSHDSVMAITWVFLTSAYIRSREKKAGRTYEDQIHGHQRNSPGSSSYRHY